MCIWFLNNPFVSIPFLEGWFLSLAYCFGYQFISNKRLLLDQFDHYGDISFHRFGTPPKIRWIICTQCSNFNHIKQWGQIDKSIWIQLVLLYGLNYHWRWWSLNSSIHFTYSVTLAIQIDWLELRHTIQYSHTYWQTDKNIMMV